MKYITFFSTTILALFMTLSASGQNKNSTSAPHLPLQIQQMDLMAADMMNMLHLMLEESNIIDGNGNLLLDIPQEFDEMGPQNFEVTIELSLVSQGEMDFSDIPLQDLLRSAITQDLDAMINANQMRWVNSNNTYAQNAATIDTRSVMHDTDNFYWLILENNTWKPNENEILPTNEFQILNWEGQLGQGISNYF